MRPVKIVTANLDFALSPQAVAKDLRNITDDAEIILFQEGKRVNVDRLILNKSWVVFQKLSTEAKKGSGVAWRVGRVRARYRDLTIGTRPHGRGILTRYLAHVTLVVRDEDGTQYELVVVSVHLPPKRFWGLIYRIMISNIARFANARKKPILFGGDWNKDIKRADDLQRLARRVNGKFYGYGIDGFLLVGRGKWEVEGTRQLPKNSPHGHHPVQITLKPKKR